MEKRIVIKLALLTVMLLVISNCMNYGVKELERVAVRAYFNSDSNPAKGLYDKQGRVIDTEKPLSDYAPVVEAARTIEAMKTALYVFNLFVQLALAFCFAWIIKFIIKREE
jgi:hypothetical protein